MAGCGRWPVAFAVLSAAALCAWSPRSVAADVTQRQFEALMHAVAAGWNEGDARKSADCFTEDAVYIEPPDRQVHRGREALHAFFRGVKPAPPTRMVWHHLAFDARNQVGFGEYTFHGNSRYHGIVVVKLRDGRISRWREYQYKSDQSWEEFTGQSRF
jgi:uncharacterized protein (TIGR02246 family)